MSTRSSFMDKQGNPVDHLTAERLLADLGYCRVADTQVASVEESFRVSTVWLGVDFSGGIGRRELFETIVFRAPNRKNIADRRYATEEEARVGHGEMLTVLLATLDDPVIVDVQHVSLVKVRNGRAV